jgi:hypothetical protein
MTGCRYRIVRSRAGDLTLNATGLYLANPLPCAVPPQLRPYLAALQAVAARHGPRTPLLSSLAAAPTRISGRSAASTTSTTSPTASASMGPE